MSDPNWFQKKWGVIKNPETYDLLVTDTNGDKHSLVGLCTLLTKEVVKLEERITKLEAENVELTNCLYEVENRLQAQIDKIHPVVYNFNNDNFDQ
jgi:hypothetical protein